MVKNDLVAIIILNYNKKEDILDCLKSIFEMEYKEFKVIVVDNNSSDESVQEIRNNFPEVDIIESGINLGVAGGRNLGIKYADENIDYKFLLFLDDDIVIDKCALSEMIGSFTLDSNIGIVTPKCYLTSKPGTIGYAGGMSINFYTGKISNIGNDEIDEKQFDESKIIPSSGGLCLVSRELINTIGIFDEKFNPYGWEDVDLSLRARKKGFKIFYNHKAVVYHKGGKIGRGKPIKEYEFSKSKNYFYLIRKHADLIQFISISICFPFRTFVIILKELITGDFRTISAQFHGIISIFRKSKPAKNF